jgi:3-(3-hydroxy-phenyl)propionate hydroxylase
VFPERGPRLPRKEVYAFDLQPEEGHAHPAFINLQQYYVEQYLVERLRTLPDADLRWLNRVVDMQLSGDGVRLTVETPAGPYRIEGDYVIAADGR